ncbi:MAG: hypothetical protein ACOC5A_01695 [Halanaerobiales bacterium]
MKKIEFDNFKLKLNRLYIISAAVIIVLIIVKTLSVNNIVTIFSDFLWLQLVVTAVFLVVFALLSDLIDLLQLVGPESDMPGVSGYDPLFFVRIVFILQAAVNLAAEVLYNVYIVDEHLLQFIILGGFIYILTQIHQLLELIRIRWKDEEIDYK